MDDKLREAARRLMEEIAYSDGLYQYRDWGARYVVHCIACGELVWEQIKGSRDRRFDPQVIAPDMHAPDCAFAELQRILAEGEAE